MNRSARRMFGGELADFVGEPITTVATPEPDHPLRRTDYLHTLAEGQAETFECRLQGARRARILGRRQRGAHRPRLAAGPQITFALLDIERRRQAEVSIAQAQASLQRVIETAPLAIALFDGAASACCSSTRWRRPSSAGRSSWCWAQPRRDASRLRPARSARRGGRVPARSARAANCAGDEGRRRAACGTRASSRWPTSAGAARRRCCWWPAT